MDEMIQEALMTVLGFGEAAFSSRGKILYTAEIMTRRSFAMLRKKVPAEVRFTAFGDTVKEEIRAHGS
jgi:hypothetical protein